MSNLFKIGFNVLKSISVSSKATISYSLNRYLNFEKASFLVFLFSVGLLHAQSTLYTEDFSNTALDNKGKSGAVLNMASVTNWSLDVSGAPSTMDGYTKQIGGVFESFNSDATGSPTTTNMTNSVVWSSLSVSIVGFSNVTFSVDLGRASNNSGSGVKAYYTLNGGTTWVEFGSVVNTAGSADNAMATFSVSGLSGTTAQIRVAHWGASATPKYRHDNVRITGVSTCTPTSSPSSLTFSNVASQSLSLSWTAGNGNRTLVVASPAALSANPTSGITYTANSSYGSGSLIGNGYVVFDGLSSVTSTAVSGLNRNTNYFFTVFTYNSSGNCYREPGVSSSRTTANLPIALYVDNNSNTGDIFTPGSSSGSNSANGKKLTPFATLTYALTQAIAGDTIYVDAGIYTSDIGILLDNTKQGISIIGAGIGLTYFDRLSSSAVNTDWFMHINTSNITLKDFTIQGYENNGTQTTAYESGQAVTIGGDATLDNNILIQNVMFNQNGQSGGNASIDILSNSNVTLLGGGSSCNLWQTMYTGGIGVNGTNINLLIENYLVAYNYKSAYDGGGLRIEGDASTRVTIKNSRFYNNIAVNGGAIAMYNGSLIVENCIFELNKIGQSTSTVRGGAFYISAGTASFKKSKFLSNTENASGTLQGGAIAARYSSTGAYSSLKVISLTIDSCIFQSNTGDEGLDIYGANGFGNACNITVRDCQFLTNSNYNIFNDGASPCSSINATYYNVSPTSSGVNITKTLSTHSLYTAAPSPPQFTGACGSITLLPVEFLDFSGACQFGSNALHWSTASEHNNAYFTIERAGNDGLFSELATIQGSQTTTSLTNYDFQDIMPLRDVNYYRLSQTDVNGDSQILKTISVDNNKCLEEGNGMFVFADQSGQYITIDYPFQSHRTMNIEIYNSIGQLIETQSLQFDSAVSRTQIHLRSSFSNGMYFLKLSDSSEAFTEKFMIRKQ